METQKEEMGNSNAGFQREDCTRDGKWRSEWAGSDGKVVGGEESGWYDGKRNKDEGVRASEEGWRLMRYKVEGSGMTG
jgi:hypothetical protein